MSAKSSVNRRIVLNDLQMLKLVELYKENKVLWKINNKYYKSQGARNQALTRIWEKLGVPELTISDLRLKINNLRSSYTKERRRKAACERSGIVHRPKLTWYKQADSFLRNYVYKRQVDEGMFELDDDADVTKTYTNKAGEEFDNTQHNNHSTQRHESLKHLLTNNENSKYILTETSQVRIKTESDAVPEELEPLDIIMENGGENINRTNGTCSLGRNDSSSNKNNVDDEYDAFAKYIAATLRNMPRKHFIIAKSLIQNTITDIELKIYNGDES